MKLLFIADVHGISNNLKYIEDKINDVDKLVILGDLYGYDGRLNDVEDFISKYESKIIWIAGNCDLDNDLMIDDDLYLIKDNSLNIYLTHGHVYNSNKKPNINNSVLIYGHKHMPSIKIIDQNYYICVGSISLPRGCSDYSYVIYENYKFIIYDLYENIIEELSVEID